MNAIHDLPNVFQFIQRNSREVVTFRHTHLPAKFDKRRDVFHFFKFRNAFDIGFAQQFVLDRGVDCFGKTAQGCTSSQRFTKSFRQLFPRDGLDPFNGLLFFEQGGHRNYGELL